MPVGTKASVKGLDVERIQELGASIMLVNTYHLWLRPGPETIHTLGGIHTFSGWKGPILSDSGGYQVFSLKGTRTLTEEGVHFKSVLDGTPLFLSPEKAVELQERYGVDIAMSLDECPPPDLSYEELRTSLERTHRWERRCLQARSNDATSLFSITQGGRFVDLRTESAQLLGELPFCGSAIGGVSVGEPKETMYEILSYHPEQLPAHKPRYLMGVGTPADILYAVRHGVDMFDCVMPTRAGRFGRAFISAFPSDATLNIRNARHAEDASPLDDACHCLTCRRYSRGYLHHLFRCEEMLGPQLLSLHNLSVYQTLMKDIRNALEGDTFDDFYTKAFLRWSTPVGKASA
jgi:queuine tRNA-ribosyltransferase